MILVRYGNFLMMVYGGRCFGEEIIVCSLVFSFVSIFGFDRRWNVMIVKVYVVVFVLFLRIVIVLFVNFVGFFLDVLSLDWSRLVKIVGWLYCMLVLRLVLVFYIFVGMLIWMV